MPTEQSDRLALVAKMFSDFQVQQTGETRGMVHALMITLTTAVSLIEQNQPGFKKQLLAELEFFATSFSDNPATKDNAVARAYSRYLQTIKEFL